jgi:hypothetical protein
MGFMPDIKGLTAKLDERFAAMMSELQAIRNVLMQILAEEQKGNNSEPPK